MAGVNLKQVVKRYGDIEVIHGVDLDIEDGEFCVFVGPSGCGKSTLLRMVAGLEDTSGGQIQIGEKDVTHADPSERGVAMVFQSYALYPHMTVEENMGFGMKMTGVPKAEIEEKVANAARILKLEPYLKRKPVALSGGQRQRVAIGRSITRGPEVFLFDEPLSNLDAELRVDMRVEISRLHKDLGTTMIYVTHDQVEAMTLADKIVVLRDGIIEQCGSPMTLYKDPDNVFVAGFIGSPGMNFLKASVAAGKVKVAALDGAEFDCAVDCADGTDLLFGIRPQDISLGTADTGVQVDFVENLGTTSYNYLTTSTGEKIVAEVKNDQVAEGQCVQVSFANENIYLFDAGTQKRLR